MTEEKFIHTNLKNELTHDFLVEILKHYHYEQKDMEMLKEVAGELRECLAGEEGFYCMTRRQCEQILNLCREENYAIGIFTLGSRVDELENRYSSTERLREAYAVETICWELLRKGLSSYRYKYIYASSDHPFLLPIVEKRHLPVTDLLHPPWQVLSGVQQISQDIILLHARRIHHLPLACHKVKSTL